MKTFKKNASTFELKRAGIFLKRQDKPQDKGSNYLLFFT